MVMIIHRATRDIERCRRKYGAAWTQYEKEVPYLFFPVSLEIRCDQNEFQVISANNHEVYLLKQILRL